MGKWTNADYVSLHNHTEFSSFDGLNKISSFPMYARKMGFKALAITDHGTVGGLIKFMRECTKSKDKDGNTVEYKPIKPILGIETYFSCNRHARSKEMQPDEKRGNRHLVLLAKNFEGYKNLCRLSQKSWTEGYYGSPRIDYELLSKCNNGLICSSACLSSVINANLYRDRYDHAKKAATLLKDIFKDDFYLEVMYHGIDAEGRIIPDIIKLGEELDIPVMASNDCHYSSKDMGKSHEVLVAMSMSKCLHDPRRFNFPYQEFYLKSAEEMAVIFGSRPELLYNTNLIADKIDADDISANVISGMRLPKLELPPGYKNAFAYMSDLAWKGLKDLKFDKSQPHIDRLKLELADVKVALDNNKYDFSTYFLVVRDYIMKAKEMDIKVGAGRGSGYGSLLLKTLGITYGPIDPLEFGLLWERFLGFSNARDIMEQDFFGDVEDEKAVLIGSDERDVVEDPGGIDRY